ncbi:MAG: cupin domain-containing protein [Streptosporangiaceae bacterium]
MTTGRVVRAGEIQPDHPAPGATVRTLLDSGSGGPGLVRRALDLRPRSRFSGTAGRAGELWFVIAGTGILDVGADHRQELIRDRGLWIPAGSDYVVQAAGEAELRLDIVMLPQTGTGGHGGGSAPDPGPALASDLQDCEVETTGDRKFRVVFGPGRGCSTATQFVGEIPPGRAPDHSHPYDELVLILDGAGIAHIGGAEHVLSPGTCLHLPPGLRHCLENDGSAMLRVLGVFHPADTPAAKLAEHA